MVRRALLLAAGVVVLGALLGLAPGRVAPPAARQVVSDAAPTSARLSRDPLGAASPITTPTLDLQTGLSPDITVALLASGRVASLPSGAAGFRLERLILAPGDVASVQPAGPALVAVEAGTLTVLSDPALAGSYGARGQLLVPKGLAVTLRNDGTEPTVLLQFELTAPTGVATPASAAAEATGRVLLTGDLPRLLTKSGQLFLARVTWAPSADSGEQLFDGPIGLAVESGTLTVGGADAAPIRLDAGRSVVVRAYTRQRVRNASSDPAVALVVGVIPERREGAVGPRETPTPNLLATAHAEATTAAARIESLASQQAQAGRTAVELATMEARAASSEATVTAQAQSAAARDAELAQLHARSATSEADAALRATNAAGADKATMSVQATRIARAMGAATAAGNDLMASRATATAQAAAQQATIAALTAHQAEAGQTVVAVTTAQSASAAALAAAEATAAALANAVNVQATQARTAAAVASAVAIDAASARATDQARLAAVQTTVADLGVAQATSDAARAVAEAQVVAAEATISTLATPRVTPTTSQPTVAALDPVYVQEQIDVDLDGLLAGNQDARSSARAELRRVLAKYEGRCRAGVVLTFGHADNIGDGIDAAEAINALLDDASPTLFAGAAFDAFGDLSSPTGQIDIRLYFFTGCRPIDVIQVTFAPTVSPTFVPTLAPTIAPVG